MEILRVGGLPGPRWLLLASRVARGRALGVVRAPALAWCWRGVGVVLAWCWLVLAGVGLVFGLARSLIQSG